MRLWTRCALILLLIASATVAAAQDVQPYIINPDDDTVSIFDSSSDEPLAVIPVGTGPVALIALPAADRLYVASADDPSVTVIDTEALAVVATLPLPAEPLSLAADEAANRVYVAHVDGTTIIVGDALMRGQIAPARPLLLPASPLCQEARRVFMTNLPPSVVDLQCRVLAVDGEFTRNPGEIGVQGVLDLGVIHAVDLFSPSAARIHNLMVCMHGEGGMLWLDASDRPRAPRTLLSTQIGDYTCAQVPALGTLVLVE